MLREEIERRRRDVIDAVALRVRGRGARVVEREPARDESSVAAITDDEQREEAEGEDGEVQEQLRWRTIAGRRAEIKRARALRGETTRPAEQRSTGRVVCR